jgi:hypothetical protein
MYVCVCVKASVYRRRMHIYREVQNVCVFARACVCVCVCVYNLYR